mgnify:CR=1 FL=1
MTTVDPAVTVALISLLGTIIGSMAGILVSNKLSIYRIEQLEKKLDKYANNVDEMNRKLIILEQKVLAAHERLDDITEQLNIHENRIKR